MGILTSIPYVHIMIKQTNSYLKAQLMTSIKWWAINSELKSKLYIGSYQEFKFNIKCWTCFITTRIIINIYFIKKHSPIRIKNLNIYIISYAYENLFTHLTQKWTELESRYQKKSYWHPADRKLGLFEYKKRHTKKWLEKNLQPI
jgi:hypothetical protein